MLTLKEIKVLARKYNISGRSWLNKRELMIAIQNVSDLKSMSLRGRSFIVPGDIVFIWQSHLFGEVISLTGSSVRLCLVKENCRKIQGDFDILGHVNGRYLVNSSRFYLEPFILRNGKIMYDGEF